MVVEQQQKIIAKKKNVNRIVITRKTGGWAIIENATKANVLHFSEQRESMKYSPLYNMITYTIITFLFCVCLRIRFSGVSNFLYNSYSRFTYRVSGRATHNNHLACLMYNSFGFMSVLFEYTLNIVFKYRFDCYTTIANGTALSALQMPLSIDFIFTNHQKKITAFL